MENQVTIECNVNPVSASKIAFIKDILHNHIYTNYNHAMELATEIVKLRDNLILVSYNPATRSIEFKIKKSRTRNLYDTFPQIYYVTIAAALQKMIIATWHSIIVEAIHNSTMGVQDINYKNKLEAYNEICNSPTGFFMLLFNITATSSNGILVQL